MAKNLDKGDLNGLASLYRARQLADRGISPNDEAFGQKYPQLFSLLGNNRVDAEHVIDSPYLRISNSAGDWLFTIGVPALGAFGEVMARTIEEGFTKLETILASGRLDWRFNVKKPPRVRSLKNISEKG